MEEGRVAWRYAGDGAWSAEPAVPQATKLG